MTTVKKVGVKWNIPQDREDDYKPRSARTHNTSLADSQSEKYVYSDTFEDQTFQHTYSDTFISDSYSDTFVNESSEGNGSNNESTNIRTVMSLKTSMDDSEIQDATNLETAKTEMLETVIEVDSDGSYTVGSSRTGYDLEATLDSARVETYTSDSHVYSDTFESSEKTKAESHYDDLRDSRTDRSAYSDSFSTRTYTGYTEDDESLLDRSFIAPDHNGKSLTDDEFDDGDSYDDDYSYTFEPTEISTYKPQDPEEARLEAEQNNLAEQTRKDFVKTMLAKLKSKPTKKYSQLETIPALPSEVEEDDYLKHYCRKKIKLLKRKKHRGDVDETQSDTASDVTETTHHFQHELLSDYGLPDSVLERAKINNILTAMRKAAKEEIHDPAKCTDCRDVKSRLDEEDAERQFVTAHAKRLKSKLMDLKVEEHLLKMNSVSMIAELARGLPLATEKPEKIFDQLFEPLLGKNVMR